jgi:hypothetical protein
LRIDWGHIRYLGNGDLWFRSYSESLCKSGKVTKALCPACRRLAVARLNRRPAGLAAAQYLRSASGLLGQSDQDQKHGGLRADLSVKSQIKNQSESRAAFL